MLRHLFVPSRFIFLLFAFLCLLAVSGARAQEASSVPVSTPYDQAYLALTAANVYVEPGISGIDTQVLEQAASQGQDSPHTPVKGLDKEPLVLQRQGSGVSV